ncbi:ubiquitin carboxyl-terminal hydrolase 14-like isoform X3 [Dendronephthya gigantea]|uniref:ubiquitin carboxyl-terminal hydrolase 14-like isoform X3 n=1 Tax=Dendronephthya gigantea TaxID=151771 RepID=UPI00106CD8C4|nr:ubiquitin carboxyl-terminal hydrolase 14-like isoform X3 [Dendronephthya gigantea]
MPSYQVSVKWGKEKFENLEVDTDELPELFKAQLYALTNVAPERQKIMLKGSVLKDDGWGNMKLKNGCMLMMMGTAGELPTAPKEKVVFMEDMSDSQLAGALKLPTGLANLGNTCYMNATVQCLCTVPELNKGLAKYHRRDSGLSRNAPGEQTILAGLKDTFHKINENSDSFPPFFLVQALYQAFPHFAEKNEHGVPMQQDANECWTQFVRILQQQLPGEISDKPENNGSESGSESGAAVKQSSLIDQYFGIHFQSTLKCDEAPDEPESSSNETLYQLSCFIDKDVKYVHTGLKNRLTETINKHSATLGRDAGYTKTSQIDRLPAYLSIQFVRFYYKEKEKINAKILKDVKFPLNLDVFELCTPGLQQKLIPIRDKFKIMDDKKLEEEKKAKLEGKKSEKMEIDEDDKKEYESYSFADDFYIKRSDLVW